MIYRVTKDLFFHYRKDGSPNFTFRKGDIVRSSKVVQETDYQKSPVGKMMGIYVQPTVNGAMRDYHNDNMVHSRACGRRSFCKGERGCFIPLDWLQVVSKGDDKKKATDMETNNEQPEMKKPGQTLMIIAGLAFVAYVLTSKIRMKMFK